MSPSTNRRSIERRLRAIRDSRPREYGVLRAYAPLLREALDDCQRTYPTTEQLCEALDDPDANRRMVGRALAILSDLEVVDTLTARNNANRYDLSTYDPARMKRLVELLVED